MAAVYLWARGFSQGLARFQLSISASPSGGAQLGVRVQLSRWDVGRGYLGRYLSFPLAVRPTVLGLALVAVLIGCTSPSPTTGVLIGGIMPCEGVPVAYGPTYAAGVVTVLEGQIQQTNAGPHLPTAVVTQEHVAVNATYRFTLKPGHYVLQATFSPPANVEPFVEATVTAGETTKADIPNVCK